ncbi:prepilin peptidase [Protaetiibacter intestinalis]|uniref:Prepilin peptidase n=1 Tax=Protaetiibacter intestinalis TaxID=2419774 RepID=A0A387B759_9MICO|nr:A24 family peptidase [Protaetiibacter intestinalis]AYF97578.1 prepilin peptidase [Protaetiibacter intestinalis]
MIAVVGGFTGALGLIIGSFLNVVAWRVPRGESIVTPPSACPSCGHEIRARDNVPVLSWLLLRGRCRDCRVAISAHYPVIELLTGAAFVAVALWLAPSILGAAGLEAGAWGAAQPALLAGTVVQLVAFLYLAALTVVLSDIDIAVHRLPNAIVLPGYVVGAVLLTAAALLMGEPQRLLVAAIGMAGSFLFYAIPAFLYPAGMGMGDVKLAGVLGMFLGYLGWEQLVVGVAAAFVVGAVAGIALMIFRRTGRRTPIPFGPWMFAGAWIGIFGGVPLASGYLKLVGLA